MSKKFIVEVENDCEGAKAIKSLLYLGRRSDETPADLAGIEVFEVTEIVNHEGRMTFEQREKLWALCKGYNVPFRETDYHRSAIGYGSYADLPPSYEGWVGGDFYSNNKAGGQKTIYVMVEHNGRSHS